MFHTTLMKVAASKLDAAAIDRIFQAWVEVGGNDPSFVTAAQIADAIRRVMETRDPIAVFTLANGYRFGSKVGFDKLCFSVRGDQVDVGMSDSYGTEGKPERLKAIQDAREAFQTKLQAIFGDGELRAV